VVYKNNIATMPKAAERMTFPTVVLPAAPTNLVVVDAAAPVGATTPPVPAAGVVLISVVSAEAGGATTGVPTTTMVEYTTFGNPVGEDSAARTVVPGL
jgi:hypothetical protein